MAIIKQYHKDTDTTYVYESESYWDPEKKQGRSRRKCIGKIDPETGEIVPTGRRSRKKKDAEPDQSDSVNVKELREQYQAAQNEILAMRTEISELRAQLKDEQKKSLEAQKYLEQIREILNKAL